MASQEKAFSIEKMPTLHESVQRDQIFDFFRKCLPKSFSREKVNKIVDSQIALAHSSNWQRSKLRLHKTMEGYVHGRYAKDATALFDQPTDGRADNVHNFLQTEARGKSYSRSELWSLIAERFPGRNTLTLYNRAISKDSNMMKLDRVTKRWHWAFDAAPKLEDVPPDTDDGSKYAERLKLYGTMPRLKNQTGEAYVREESEVLKFMAEKSGNSNLDWLEAEFNRLSYAWINSLTGEKDSERDIARANRIYDRGTKEWLGPLTYREELKQTDDVCDDAKKVIEVDEADEPEADTAWMQEGYDYLVRNEDTWEYAIGLPGRRRVLDPDAISRIENLGIYDEKDAHQLITKILKEYAVSGIKVEAFVKNAVELAILKWVNGGDDLEGYQTYRSRTTREKYGWPSRLPSEFDLKLVFQRMVPSSSLVPFADRAKEFVSMYLVQLNGSGITEKLLVKEAWKRKGIVKREDGMFRIAA